MTKLEKLKIELKNAVKNNHDAGSRSIMGLMILFLAGVAFACWYVFSRPDPNPAFLILFIFVLVGILPFLVTYLIFWLEKRKKGLRFMSVRDFIIEESRGDI